MAADPSEYAFWSPFPRMLRGNRDQNGAVRTRVVLASVMVVLAAACSSSTGGGDRTAPVTLGATGWLGARTAGRANLVVAFVGAPPYRAGDPCSAAYAASAEERSTSVLLTFTK